MRRVRWLALAGLALGCHATPAEAPPRGGPGDLEVVVENHLGWPYRVESLAVALDGQLVHRSRGESPERLRVAVLRALPRGEHTLQFRAEVAYASGAVTDTCLATVRASDTFVVTERAGRVTLDVYARGPSAPFDERLRVNVRRLGVASTGEIHAAEPASACAGTADELQRVACRARERVAEARQQKDVVALSCYDEKLRAVEKLQREADRAALEPGSRAVERRAIRDSAALLSRELDACVSSYPALVGFESAAERPACRGDELLPGAPSPSEPSTRPGLR